LRITGGETDEGRGDLQALFQAHDLMARQEGHFLGHAVGATEIAAVGDRQAHVGDATAIFIDQGARCMGTRRTIHCRTEVVQSGWCRFRPQGFVMHGLSGFDVRPQNETGC